jgi:DNA polymerase III epsilon subunit family exonuclease
MNRDPLEIEIQTRIMGELGCIPGVLLLRNAIDHRLAHFGLGEGSPDIVGFIFPWGRMLGLEVKRPGKDPTDIQLKVHTQWRMRGAYVAVVRSVEDARVAIARSRKMSASKEAWADHGESLATPNGFVVFDTETTGLAATDRIVEIACARVESGRVVDKFEMLVNPEMSIPPAASGVHGIYDRDVANAPLIAEVIEAFRRFVGAYPLVAHNAAFDVRMLRAEARRTRSLLPFSPVVCSLKALRKLIPKLPMYKLDALIECYWVKRSAAHWAMLDVLALVDVLRGIMFERNEADKSSGTKPITLREAHGPAEILCELTEEGGAASWAT